MEVEDEAEFISSIINEISYVKGERLDLKYYYSQNCPEEWFKKLYDGYDEMLEQTGKIDFDDMLVMCHELFTERKDILAAWQKKIQVYSGGRIPGHQSFAVPGGADVSAAGK